MSNHTAPVNRPAVRSLFPPDLPPDRAALLLRAYLDHRDRPGPGSPPGWYTRAAIAELRAGRGVAA